MSFEDPGSYYSSIFEDRVKLKQKLFRDSRYFSIARFISFVFFLLSLMSALTLGIFWWWPACFLLIIFILLVVFHERLVNNQKFNDACITAIEQELEAINGKYTSFDDGGEFNDPSHIFTTDLDIFGDYSLFQSLNRTATLAGKSKLGDWLRNPLHDKSEIVARQEAVKELALKPDWRIRLRANGLVADEEKKDLELLFDWLSTEPLFTKGYFSIAKILVPLASLTVSGLFISGLVSVQMFLIYLILPLAFTGTYTKAINRRHVMLSKKVELLQKYSIRFRMIEEEGFATGFMKNVIEKLVSGDQPASRMIRKLGKITASLDTRLNLLAGFILNIYLLWDIRQMMRLELWQQSYKDKLPRWFEALAETEAIASLSAFSFDNPGFVFPDIITDRFVIQAVDACHPLIPALQRINNNISVTHRGHFNIVTGANMAGKSTYLRTIGVNMILALTGAPVCAVSFSCYPAKVFTSLRTTDSLSTNQSYFYAELLRLKELIDRLNNGDELFILLDEILKGTNSIDKQAGSKALLSQLIGLGAAGFIATHDLELGNLIGTFPEDVTNYSFEAEIDGEELHFDYKLKPGIARNMNATFLMKKMGITI
jgi:hypothetical protein